MFCKISKTLIKSKFNKFQSVNFILRILFDLFEKILIKITIKLPLVKVSIFLFNFTFITKNFYTKLFNISKLIYNLMQLNSYCISIIISGICGLKISAKKRMQILNEWLKLIVIENNFSFCFLTFNETQCQ